MSAIDWRALPKTELHLHLEGAIPHDTMLELIRKYGDAAQVPDRAALERRLQYASFPEFIDVWTWKNRYVRDCDDLRLIACGVAHALRDQGVRYAELHFSPGDFRAFGLELQAIALAIRSGFADAAAGPGPDSDPQLRLIVDLIRDLGPEAGARRLEEAAEVAKEAGIVAVGIGGSEHTHPPEPFAPVYARAEALGLHRVAHAGEAAGPESVWGALGLGVERIGHGTRCHEDPALVEHLAETGIPLEICLSSNVRTGVVSDPSEHPLARYVRSGLLVTLSTDDPAMFDTDAVREYERAAAMLGLDDAELLRIARTGFEVAFLDDDDRALLLADFESALPGPYRGSVG